jgi:hypothetical protein
VSSSGASDFVYNNDSGSLFFLNPLKPLFGNSLGEASSFVSFMILSITAHWMPTVSSLTNGDMYISYNPDASAQPARSIEEMMAGKFTSATVSSAFHHTFEPQPKWLFVNGGNNEPILSNLGFFQFYH